MTSRPSPYRNPGPCRDVVSREPRPQCTSAFRHRNSMIWSSDGRMPRPRIIDSRKVWDVYELDMAFDELPREDGPSIARSSWDDR